MRAGKARGDHAWAGPVSAQKSICACDVNPIARYPRLNSFVSARPNSLGNFRFAARLLNRCVVAFRPRRRGRFQQPAGLWATMSPVPFVIDVFVVSVYGRMECLAVHGRFSSRVPVNDSFRLPTPLDVKGEGISRIVTILKWLSNGRIPGTVVCVGINELVALKSGLTSCP